MLLASLVVSHTLFALSQVETIGDCYMCVTGLPEPDENHAVNMARFAYQIVTKMESICQDLEGYVRRTLCRF